jgi:Tol biopolymer transport system component
MSTARILAIVGLVALLGLSVWWRTRPTAVPDESPHLAYVATAHQLGVVGYRDPVGAIDASGERLAYSEGRKLRVVPTRGGVSLQTPEAEGQIRHIAWIGTTGELIVEDTGAKRRWWIFTAGTARKRPLWEGREAIDAAPSSGTEKSSVDINALRQIAVAPDGQSLAALVSGQEGPELWRVAIDGSRGEVQRTAGQPSSPMWTSATEVACVIAREGRSHLTLPCGGGPLRLTPDIDVIGPIAFTADGAWVYFASPNSAGMVDLWIADRMSGRARRLSSFARDSYAPSVAANGTIVFKTQSYRTHVAEMELASGVVKQLTTFQAETPFYDPAGKRISVTYGTWRRVMDDAKYPDIAQEIGVIASWPEGSALDKPLAIIADSNSEDQAMSWSPNGRWIALHSHREWSDDIWLRPADGTTPDRRITFLGRGAEVGWPRWSRDGTMVLLDGASPNNGRSVLFVIGVDQTSGKVTSELREIPVEGFTGEITHAEWLPDNRTLVAIGKEGPGRHVILETSIVGGDPRIVHRFESEHDFPGLAASPDGREVAFVAPADDGFFQIFRLSLTEGLVARITTDPSHKTQPAWSPDGRRIAFTVWSYDAQFWALR